MPTICRTSKSTCLTVAIFTKQTLKSGSSCTAPRIILAWAAKWDVVVSVLENCWSWLSVRYSDCVRSISDVGRATCEGGVRWSLGKAAYKLMYEMLCGDLWAITMGGSNKYSPKLKWPPNHHFYWIIITCSVAAWIGGGRADNVCKAFSWLTTAGRCMSFRFLWALVRWVLGESTEI